VALLWRWFQDRFDPHLTGNRERAAQLSRDRLDDELRAITDHDQDIAFRTLTNLVESTLRTNFYQSRRPYHYLSFKIDCGQVTTMPLPRMQYEIYVHHREVEGVHLRGGPIARGGIRWSDRADYRQEILGLVTTQMVKNVLIVPEGAKGGFYVKHAHPDPRGRRAQADALYQVFIQGLLDLTDDIRDEQVMPPPETVRYDGHDPYLVVAADKGTAHLSDTANGLARTHGFWLDDAFASGGSNGYDHKEVGITARGAWQAARVHFLEMGHDPDADEFTAMGIGDPSGDVFGNGVLETRKMRLLAAFNHLHVFLDPGPDTEVAYNERQRLFRECKGWDHYDTALISEGGGVFSRRAKSIPLTPQLQQLLGVLGDEIEVDAAIRLLLRMNVDLFWNGGIGTYVKASTETHPEALDPPNDTIRINADELRCRIVAEGGNLGFTQAGRVEYALGGGRINTDAIDNSGGVDMSDHEVNLKILLAQEVGARRLKGDARDALIRKFTDEIAHQVLANNDL
ncbi:MAG: NAD-glutamate dehydrogenase, partial [Myxococcota bacterium]|nr:NAD-glutamate dehydrogenase [Myxococcota bacterium]